MWTRLAIACAALSSATLVRGDEYFTGDMTAYTLGQPSAGNCNFMNSPSDAAVNYAALNAPQWASTKNCGRCALVSCADSRCADQSKTQLVYILDQCPECKTGDLDVAPSVFKTLTGSDPSRYTIKWKFVDCPVTGNIKYCLKGGSNAFWTAIQPTNAVTGVQSMQINSQATTMVTSAYYYLLNGQSTTQTDLSSVKVTLTSVSGEVVTDTVSLTAGSCTDGVHQFSRGTSPSPAAPVPAPAPTSAPTPAPAPVTQTPTPTTQTPVAQTTTAPTTVAPVTTQPVQQSTDNSTVGAEAGVPETGSSSDTEKPGTVKAGDANSSISSREAEERTTTGTEESGLLDAIDSTSTPSSDSTTSDKNAAGSSGTADASTRSGASESTSPAVIALSVMGGIGVVALAVLAVVVKRKRMMDKEDAERDDSMMVVNLRSFDTPDNARNRLDVSTL